MSRVGIFVDSNYHIIEEAGSPSGVDKLTYYDETIGVYGRHSGFNNLLFMDGHVDSKKGYGILVDGIHKDSWDESVVWDIP